MEKLHKKIAQILDTVYSATQHIGEVYNTEALEQIMEAVTARDAFVIGKKIELEEHNHGDNFTNGYNTAIKYFNQRAEESR